LGLDLEEKQFKNLEKQKIRNNILEFIKKYINWFLVLIIIIFLVIIFKKIFPVESSKCNTVIIKDTTILTRYEKELKNDTVIKWYDKIVYKKIEPEKIYLQKTDTVFIERTKELDLMLQVKKENKKLIIKAVNQNGKTMKEYVYENVYNDFTAVSQKDNIYVKSKMLYWNKINSIINVQWSMFREKRINIYFGLETGISLKNKIDLNAGVLYSPDTKDLLLNTNLKIKF
jgi:hypothetical protein